MSKILVSGAVNVETNLKVDEFPLNYNPVNFAFFGINTNVAGVGFNLCKSLKTLGDEVVFLSITGNDLNSDIIGNVLDSLGVSKDGIKKIAKNTAQSVILYTQDGKRQIFTDLKDIQDITYPAETFEKALEDCDILIISNINFSRKFLSVAKAGKKLIATDVQAISDIEDSYNQDFLNHADILFFSDDKLGERAEMFLRELSVKYPAKIIVAGLGSKGAYMFVREDNFFGKFEAYKTREVVNTVGAGDSLFSSFVHFYAKGDTPYCAIKKAMLYASWKIGESGASNGFIPEGNVEELYEKFINE